MESRKKTAARIGLVFEALFLACVLIMLIDTLILALRMGHGVNLPFVTTSLALIVPGAFLVKGYSDYAQGSRAAGEKILACAAVTSVIFGLSLVPGCKTLLFGIGDIPAFQTLNIRFMQLAFGMRGTNYIFLIDFVVQAVLPLVLIALCKDDTLVHYFSPRNLIFALLRIAGSVLAVWAAFAVMNWLIRSDTFGHSWLIVGFIPIPGQIMLIFPFILAFGVIVVIWTKPWDN